MPFVKREYEYYKYIYEDYTLPTMTSNTAPEGLVESDVSISGGYATQIYPLFFNNHIAMSAYANRSSGRYIKYTFKNLLLPDTYNFEYVFGAENNVTVQENRWEVIYDDDTSEEILNALDEKSATKTATFTTKKCIKAIKLNLYISAPSDQYCYMTINSISLTSQDKEKNTVKIVKNTYMVNLGGEDVYEDWQQPVLSANDSSSILTVSATNEGQGAAWKVFDDDTNSEWATANNVTSGTLTAVLNKDIYITSIEVTGLQNQYGSTNTIAIYSDTNKQNVIGEQKSFDYSTSNTLIWNFEEPIKANTLVFYGVGTTWVVIRNIKITAKTLKAVGGNDYDYYVNHNKLYQLARRNRDYYKYGTEPNATVVGSPTIVEGVVSGFSASNYLEIPKSFLPNGQSWEAVTKVNATSFLEWSCIFSLGYNNSSSSNKKGISINAQNGKLYISFANGGSNFTHTASNIATLSTNTDYWVKVEFTGNEYNLYLSTSGEFEEPVYTYTSSVNFLTENVKSTLGTYIYGGSATTQGYWVGSIDLNESYININGTRWWHGTKVYPVNLGGEDVYEDWTQPVLSANGTMGGDKFAVADSSNYSGWDAWEAFDGVLTGYNGWSASSNSYPQHLIFYNPVQLLVKKLTVINNYEGNVAFTAGNVYGSNDGSSWTLITSYINDNTTSGARWDIVLDGNKTLYKYHKLEITKGNFISTNLIKCTEVLITAQTLKAIGGNDYDYYVNHNKLYQLVAVKRKYWKYDEESTLINADGVVTSATGGNGWRIYTQANYEEVFLMLNATALTTYPRWQTGSPNVYAYIKTPKKGIVTSYLTTQWCDENTTGRICNHWIITGYENEADMLALTNGTVIDDNTWASASKGTSKTVTLDNNKAFQYYTIHMVSNFANGSYCSMGNTKFYMREPVESTSSDYDYYEDKFLSF